MNVPFLKRMFLFLFIVFCTSSLTAKERIHRIIKNETLFSISLQYQLSLKELMDYNDLIEEQVFEGQTLKIPEKPPLITSNQYYLVVEGDSLSKIALKNDLTLEQLKSLNRLTSEEIFVGQKLLLQQEPLKDEVWIVQSGDTLSWISLKYNISQERLMQINNLNTKALYIGQKINLNDPAPQFIIVKKGDSLWEIAQKYNREINSLKEWNHLKSESLRIDQKIQLYSQILENESALQDFEDFNHKTQLASFEEITPYIDINKDLKSNTSNLKNQPDREYYKSDYKSALNNYKKGCALYNLFKKESLKMPPLGTELQGYSIVIDPGHGGVDPGAIVESTDGLGNKIYVVEDEYAYDISLRLARILLRHGAEVNLTILSPDHQIRNYPSNKTFLNVKNEVYNNYQINKEHKEGKTWPVGQRWALDMRKAIAQDFFKSYPKDKTLFISIHADNNKRAPSSGSVALYSAYDQDRPSKNLASSIKDCLGIKAYCRSQELRVLKDNSAGESILVEIRNIAFTGNAWLIRDPTERQRDAQNIARGVLNFYN